MRVNIQSAMPDRLADHQEIIAVDGSTVVTNAHN